VLTDYDDVWIMRCYLDYLKDTMG